MVMALIVFSLVATTMTMLAVGAMIENKRTRIAMEDAQLRQLLIAGELAAQSSLQKGATADSTLALPDALQQPGAAVKMRIEPGATPDERWIEVEASLPRHRISQRVHVMQHNAIWEITGAQLGD
jgi:hypothetical protein